LGEDGFQVPTAVTINTKKSYPENGGSKFIRNIGNNTQKTVTFVFIAVRTANHTALNMDHKKVGGGGGA
jgi:hypothetical protein